MVLRASNSFLFGFGMSCLIFFLRWTGFVVNPENGPQRGKDQFTQTFPADSSQAICHHLRVILFGRQT